MKIFIAFIFICFGVGILLRNRGLKTSIYLLFGLVAFVSLGYFFFNQI